MQILYAEIAESYHKALLLPCLNLFPSPSLSYSRLSADIFTQTAQSPSLPRRNKENVSSLSPHLRSARCTETIAGSDIARVPSRRENGLVVIREWRGEIILYLPRCAYVRCKRRFKLYRERPAVHVHACNYTLARAL